MNGGTENIEYFDYSDSRFEELTVLTKRQGDILFQLICNSDSLEIDFHDGLGTMPLSAFEEALDKAKKLLQE